MEYHTFEEWKLLGYYVVFGEKSTKRNEKGICVFSEDQVAEREDISVYGGIDPSDFY